MVRGIYLWSVKNRAGMIYWSSVGFSISRRGAIALFMNGISNKRAIWKQYYRRGYRAVQVRLTEIAP
jgi:hypothetical protein